MLKKLIVLTVVFAVAALAGSYVMPAPSGIEMLTAPACQSLDEEGGALVQSGSVLAPGFQGGVTMYDYQQNGAMGNRIALDADGNVHINWMHSEDESFGVRDVYYNAWEAASEDFVWSSGVKASGTPRAGYTTMGILSTGEAVVAFHHSPESTVSAVVVDAANMVGSFSSPVDVSPSNPATPPIWPHMVVDADDVIHVTGHVHWDGTTPAEPPLNYNYLYYSRSTDAGVNFSTWEVISENAGDDAAMAASADGKVAIAWGAGFPITGTSGKFATNGNVLYVESTNNGQSWSSEVEVTDGYYGDEQPNTRDTVSLGALTRMIDCCYDGDNNLHIAWGDAWRSAYENPDDNNKVYYSYYPRWFARGMEWCEDGPAEPTVASGPHNQFLPLTEEGDTIEWLNIGFWGIAQSVDGYVAPGLGFWNPQLSAWGSDMVYTWSGQWDSLDVTGAGTINADIFASITTDNGNTWKPVEDWYDTTAERDPVWGYVTNLTNTHSPGAGIGASESEGYHSTYPLIGSDGILHITYIHDLFAGPAVMPPTQGIVTTNPVMYFPVDSIKVSAEVINTSAIAENLVPNAVVTVLGENLVANSVAFSVSAPGQASFKIYDAAGSLVETLAVEGSTVTWDVSSVSSGVYFYSLVTPDNTASGRVVVVH